MVTVTLSKNIISDASVMSKALNRFLADQIEHWVYIGKVVEDNLTYACIKNILIARQEVIAGTVEEYSIKNKNLF